MLKTVCLWLTIIGGLNWGLVGLFNFNLVNFIVMNTAFLEHAIYIIVGLASVISIYYLIAKK
ncbi:MAG: DUF378 domain-containing protein [Alphaproteobacteria bacterium]